MIDQDRVMSQTSKNRVEQWLEHLGTPALPVPGFEIEAGRTALVITYPQNDFLHSDGIARGACGEGVTKNGFIANFWRYADDQHVRYWHLADLDLDTKAVCSRGKA